jgi:hypothetical protein
MAQFIVNPRRAPRAPTRCRAAVVCRHGQFEADTEDIGSMGCQVVSPHPVQKGEGVRLTVTNEKIAEPLEVIGRVAWVSPQAPWRVGIAFEERSLAGSARWFDRLIAAHPGLGGYRRVPDRIRADATVYLGPPPRFLVDFTAEEALLLRAIGGGAQVYELMARLRDRWALAQRALFSLIARQAVTLRPEQAVHPDSWKKILTDIEASLAVESLAKDASVEASGAPPQGPPASRSPAARERLETASPAPAQTDSPRGIAPVLERGAGWAKSSGRSRAEARAERAAARAAPREEPRRRNGEAQAAYDRAIERIRAGNSNGVLALLRLALSLAPGDREILDQIAKLEKDRPPRGG